MNTSRTVMSSLAAIWAVGGFAASVVTEGTVTTLDVPEGEIYVYEEALAAPTTQFVKTGAGTARFVTAAPAYTGEILIREGVADFTVPKAYGTGPITVSDGAQLVVSHASENQNVTLVAGTVTVAGSGPDGSGAIRFTGSGMGDWLFAKLVLAGDATIGGNRHGYKTIDFQHHVFTWVGGNLMVNGHTWMNFEKLVHNGTADICFQGWHGIDQSAAGKPIVIVNDRAHISFWGSTEPIPYALVYDVSSSLRVNAGDAVKWAGPITVAAGKTLEIQTNKEGKRRKITLSGEVGGEGAVVIGGDQDGTVVFDNLANTWTGGYVQKRSTVQVRAPGSLPGYNVLGRVSVTGGTLELMHATGWTVDDAKKVEAIAALGTGGTLAFNLGGETVAPGLGTRKDVTYAFTGRGTARLPEVLCDDGKFLGNGADVVLGGESAVARRLTWFRVRGGTTTLDGVDLHVTNTWNREFTIGGAGAETARLVLTNGARMLVLNAPLPLVPPNDGISLPTTYVGGTGTGPAVVELNDGCALTGKVSAVEGGRSVWNIRGGELVDVTGPVSDGYLSFGQNGYAYIDQTGGRFLGRAHSGLMRGGSTGIYHLRGGTFGYIPGQWKTCNFTLSRGDGMGVLHQTGGVHDTPDKSLYMGIQDYSDPAGGLAVATLDGPNALMKVESVDLGRRLTNFTAIVNLMNGGVLNTKAISHSVAAERVNTHGYVNFNGGVFRAAGANTDVFGPDGRRPARVTVFRKGAVFDTAGFDCGLGAPGLAAPSGKGVEKIEIPDSAKRTGYYGSPEVVITGDGTGATAFCEFDAATGTIGPITVTCPGWDYTTATATIRTADRTDTVALAVTLATQTGGGLVKLGANTLTLNGVHTYAGETVVSNGTLRLAAAASLPATNTVMLAGGTLDLNNAAVAHELGTLGGFGTVANGALAVKGLRFHARDLIAPHAAALDVTATLAVADGAPVVVEEPELLPATGRSYTLATSRTAFPRNLVLEGLAMPWQLVCLNEGKTLKLLCARSTAILLR